MSTVLRLLMFLLNLLLNLFIFRLKLQRDNKNVVLSVAENVMDMIQPQSVENGDILILVLVLSLLLPMFKRIVEQEQNGNKRAQYGQALIDALADELTKEYGKSFSKRNLQYFRKFYIAFPDERIVNACVHNLTWTHFRSLLRVPDENARLWYMNEASNEGWSSRTLDRNISTQYFYRLMQSPKKNDVVNEMLLKKIKRISLNY